MTSVGLGECTCRRRSLARSLHSSQLIFQSDDGGTHVCSDECVEKASETGIYKYIYNIYIYIRRREIGAASFRLTDRVADLFAVIIQ